MPREALEDAAVMNEASDGTGAPRDEIEITPEMIRVGAEIIWRAFNESLPYGSSWGEEVARMVYSAMAVVAQGKEPGERVERMQTMLQKIPYDI